MAEQAKVPDHMKFVIGGLSGMTAMFFVQPMDLVKTRMQMCGAGGRPALYASSLDCLMKAVRLEGLPKLWTGFGAGLLRQATYTTGRMGVYQILVEQYKQNISRNPSLADYMAMGTAAGAAGAVIGNPAEVVLIRMVTDGKYPPERRRNYKNVFDALFRIAKEEGFKGLWSGVLPTMERAMVVNMTQLASYSHFKVKLRQEPLEMKENLTLHVVASTLSGLVTSVTSMPFDIAKTRIQNMQLAGEGPQYSGMLDVLMNAIEKEGITSLWKGFMPYFCRITPHTIMTFIFFEQYNNLYCKYILGTKTETTI